MYAEAEMLCDLKEITVHRERVMEQRAVFHVGGPPPDFHFLPSYPSRNAADAMYRYGSR